MSSTKSKLDLLVRVRFQNPLPPPPFPPKLLNIPTDPTRYATLEYTGDMANEMPFPMVIDAEMGMPLDLSRYECLWQDGADPRQLEPDPDTLPPVDPEDEFMLEGFTNLAGPSRTGSQTVTGSQPLQVSWLRRTEYVTAKDSSSRAQLLARDEEDEINVDISREAQIRDVEATFPPSYKGIDIATLKHPSKPGRKAVEVFDVLPDPETFASLTDIFRFPEKPGRKANEDDPRLDCAILRPVRLDDGESFIAYYLAREVAQAQSLRQSRNISLGMNMIIDSEETPFDLIRDYEAKVSLTEQGNEMVLVFDDGTLPPHSNAVGSKRQSEPRPSGVYYKAISRRHILKRKRVDPNDPTEYQSKMDIINLQYRELDDNESTERDNELEELLNPFYEPLEAEEEPAPIMNGQNEMDE